MYLLILEQEMELQQEPRGMFHPREEQLLKDHEIIPEEIASIEDRTYHTALETTDNPYPATPYAAKFSLQFCLAALLVTGSLDDRAFMHTVPWELCYRMYFRNAGSGQAHVSVSAVEVTI